MRELVGKRRSGWQSLSVVFGVLLLAGCAGLMPKPDPTNPIRTVAILPFENGTNEIDGPDKVREALAGKFRQKFYRVIDMAETDLILRERLGITLGGQLNEVELAQITEVLEADGLLFGNLTHYDHVVTGVLNEKMVRAELRLVQVATGNTFWSSEVGVKSRSSDGGIGNLLALAQDIGQATSEEAIQWIAIETQTSSEGGLMGNLLSGIVDKAVGNAFGVSLAAETNAFVENTTRSLRNGPGN